MKTSLVQYMIPEEMKQYLSNFGMHFNKKLCSWAVSHMEKEEKDIGVKKPISPITMDELETLLDTYKVEIESNNRYDALYLANMVKADFLGSSIEDKEHMAKYIKDVLCDADGYDGIVFNRFRADCDAKGVVIYWDLMI